MTDTGPNRIHIDRMWGLFIGQLNDNVLHQHYALQICIASKENFALTDENGKQEFYASCFINSNVKHRFNSNETSLILLLNPISSIGHQLHKNYYHEQIAKLNSNLEQLNDSFSGYLKEELTFSEFVENVSKHLTNFNCACELENHFEDDRIYRAIQYLEQNVDRIVSLKEIAEFCFLSETRFLHLFKEKTNLSFRGFQRWNKLIKSLPYLKTHSITETAHQSGFTDSAHFTRSFKETFGLSPKILTSIK